MLVFPNCKINLGLNVIEKRSDGFHNIETVFYPVNWCDALEIIPAQNQSKSFQLHLHGTSNDIDPQSNLLSKVWNLIGSEYNLTGSIVHLYKNIPIGAGLGGGSADAVFFIELINNYFKLQMSKEKKLQIATSLGSDCSFFMENSPSFATGKGDILSPIKIDLSGYYLLLVYPNVMSSTVEAYQKMVPKKSQHDLRTVIETLQINKWKDTLTNNFEAYVFNKFPVVKSIKEKMYNLGAVYASMSGSGSTVFGIFESKPNVNSFKDLRHFLQKPLRSS